MHPDDRVESAILLDEIGLASGRHRDFVLKSAYRTIFAREGRNLAPVAVEGVIAALRDRQPVDLDFFRAEIAAAGDAGFVETLARALHVINLEHLGAPWLSLVLTLDAGRDAGTLHVEMHYLASILDDMGMDGSKLACAVPTSPTADADLAMEFATTLRGQGMGIVVRDFGADPSALDCVNLTRPDFVGLDRRLIRDLGQLAAGAKLLASLVRGLHELGARVMASGIDTAGDLETALVAGVDFFQGDLLSQPARAGTVFDFRPLPIQALLRPAPKVVFLRA